MAGMIQAISGDDTLVLSDRVFLDLADGDISNLEFPNDLVTVKTGKNKNSIFAKNADGNNCVLTLRLIRGSSDDKFLNSKLAALNRDFAAFETLTGQFIKRIGDGEGNITYDTYDLSGGIFQKPVAGKENVDGDVSQAVAVYTIKFTLGIRSI